jgi:hypothetical protein
MSKQVQVQVSTEAYDLMIGLAKFCGAVKTSLADGWQMGTDFPALMTAAIADIVPVMSGIMQLPVEATTETAEFAKAITIGAAEIYNALKKIRR